MARVKGKTLSIYSAKGGVGKSITALNLAGVFASLEQKVLIMDLDLTAGSIATYLNKPFKKTIYNFVDDYLNNNFNTISDYVTKYNDNIFFVATCKDPRQSVDIDQNYIKMFLEKASFEYDSIILDLSHDMSEFNISVLDMTDETLVVLNNDLIALKNTLNLISIFNDASKKNFKVLLNNCINPCKNYFSLYDIKNIIGHNIDYKIDNSFYIKTIDNYIVDGSILTLDKKMTKVHPKVYKTYVEICSDLREAKDE